MAAGGGGRGRRNPRDLVLETLPKLLRLDDVAVSDSERASSHKAMSATARWDGDNDGVVGLVVSRRGYDNGGPREEAEGRERHTDKRLRARGAEVAQKRNADTIIIDDERKTETAVGQNNDRFRCPAPRPRQNHPRRHDGNGDDAQDGFDFETFFVSADDDIPGVVATEAVVYKSTDDRSSYNQLRCTAPSGYSGRAAIAEAAEGEHNPKATSSAVQQERHGTSFSARGGGGGAGLENWDNNGHVTAAVTRRQTIKPSSTHDAAGGEGEWEARLASSAAPSSSVSSNSNKRDRMGGRARGMQAASATAAAAARGTRTDGGIEGAGGARKCSDSGRGVDQSRDRQGRDQDGVQAGWARLRGELLNYSRLEGDGGGERRRGAGGSGGGDGSFSGDRYREGRRTQRNLRSGEGSSSVPLPSLCVEGEQSRRPTTDKALPFVAASQTGDDDDIAALWEELNASSISSSSRGHHPRLPQTLQPLPPAATAGGATTRRHVGEASAVVVAGRPQDADLGRRTREPPPQEPAAMTRTLSQAESNNPDKSRLLLLSELDVSSSVASSSRGRERQRYGPVRAEALCALAQEQEQEQRPAHHLVPGGPSRYYYEIGCDGSLADCAPIAQERPIPVASMPVAPHQTMPVGTTTSTLPFAASSSTRSEHHGSVVEAAAAAPPPSSPVLYAAGAAGALSHVPYEKKNPAVEAALSSSGSSVLSCSAASAVGGCSARKSNASAAAKAVEAFRQSSQRLGLLEREGETLPSAMMAINTGNHTTNPGLTAADRAAIHADRGVIDGSCAATRNVDDSAANEENRRGYGSAGDGGAQHRKGDAARGLQSAAVEGRPAAVGVAARDESREAPAAGGVVVLGGHAVALDMVNPGMYGPRAAVLAEPEAAADEILASSLPAKMPAKSASSTTGAMPPPRSLSSVRTVSSSSAAGAGAALVVKHSLTDSARGEQARPVVVVGGRKNGGPSEELSVPSMGALGSDRQCETTSIRCGLFFTPCDT